MKRKLLVLFAAVLLLAVIAFLFRRHLSLEQLIAHEDGLRQAIAAHGWRAFFLGFLLYVVASLVPGTIGKSLVYGWLFGFWQALLIVNVSLTAAATLTFWFGRFLFRDALYSRFGHYLLRVNAAIESDGPWYLITLRMLHVPFTFVNYAMSATSMKGRTFWWATQLGLLPGNAVFVYAGVHLPTLRRLQEHGLHGLISLPLLIALLLMGLLPLLMRTILHRFWPKLKEAADLAH